MKSHEKPFGTVVQWFHYSHVYRDTVNCLHAIHQVIPYISKTDHVLKHHIEGHHVLVPSCTFQVFESLV